MKRAGVWQGRLGVVLLGMLSACTVRVGGGAFSGYGNETNESAKRVATFDGDECIRAYYALDEHNPSSDYNRSSDRMPEIDNPSPVAQILLATCVRRSKTGTYGHDIEQWNKVKPLSAEEVYLGLDDRKLDMVSAALTAVFIMNPMDRHYDRYEGKKWAGLVRFYGEIIDRDALAAEVRKVAVPDEAKVAFLKLYDDAVARAAAVLFSPAESRLLVDIPVETVKARRAHFNKYDGMYKLLDKLVAQGEKARGDAQASEALVGLLVDLRSKFMEACAKVECRAFPLWAHTTRELALVHVSRNSLLDAEVESAMQSGRGRYVADMPQAVFVAQQAELQQMLEAQRKYKKAKENGVDDKTARSLAGSPYAGEKLGYNPEGDLLFHPKMELPNYAKALDEKSSYDYGRAQQVPLLSVQSAGGGKSKLTFEKETYKGEEAVNCRMTNRITRIRSDGTLEYEEICDYRPTSRTVELHAPVMVPEAEAKPLKKGDKVMFVSRGGEARIMEVKRGDAVVQLRGDAF